MALELKSPPQQTVSKVESFRTPSGGGTSIARSPRSKVQLKNAATDTSSILGCVFGSTETGKTTIGAQLACAGYRVFMCFTDLGGDAGEKGARVYASKIGKSEEYERNAYFAAFDDLEELKEFFVNPTGVIPNIWSAANPDVILWDGFGFWQSIHVLPSIEEQANSMSKDKNAPEDGFSNAAMMKGWGLVRNATIRPLSAFLRMRNPNKEHLHKIITIGLKSQSQQIDQSTSKIVELNEPDVSGSAKSLMRYGFDFCLQTQRNGTNFSYVNRTKKEGYAKNRLDLPEIIDPADFASLWAKMLIQSGVKS